MTFARITTLVAAVALIAGLSAPVALALKAPAKQTTKKSAKKPAAKTTKKSSKKAAARKPASAKTTSTSSRAAAKPAKKSSSKTKPSACAGLAQSQCGAKKECGWIKPKKKVSSNGRKLTAYCRKVAGISRKKKPK